MTAAVEGAFVAFLIGAPFNKPWMLVKVISVARAMTAWPEARPSAETGYLGRQPPGFAKVVRDWRSFEHPEACARPRAPAGPGGFQPTLQELPRRCGDRARDLPHRARPDRDGLRRHAPPSGLGGAVGVVPVTGRREAARMSLAAGQGGEA